MKDILGLNKTGEDRASRRFKYAFGEFYVAKTFKSIWNVLVTKDSSTTYQ